MICPSGYFLYFWQVCNATRCRRVEARVAEHTFRILAEGINKPISAQKVSVIWATDDLLNRNVVADKLRRCCEVRPWTQS